jgi:hypothetical protein
VDYGVTDEIIDSDREGITTDSIMVKREKAGEEAVATD